MNVLQDLSSEANALDEIARLRAENERLKAVAKAGLRFKVSEKGALSVYGMGRFPVTLYKGQWLKLFEVAEQIVEYIGDHPELSEKD